jgi:Zn-dependent peptidase ImmA (M78 family)
MAQYSDEEWEEIARKWRQAAGMDHTIRLDAPNFVRWLKHAGYIKDYVCVPDQSLPEAEGKYDPDQARIFYRQSIWDAAERRHPHATWTLMHEACHAIRRHKELRYRSDTPDKGRLSRRAGPDEFEANHLTACILAPFHKADFRLGVTIDEIQNKFGLSRKAAAKRLEEFERMLRRKLGIPRQLPGGVADFLAAQKRKGHTITSLDNIGPMIPSANEHYRRWELSF